ncbi:MAG: sensor histidine kinase [Colwellia sp.]|nr:sensor histidine kinase [Colwellia sp.]
MALLKTNSLESYIQVKLMLLCAVVLLLTGYVLWLITIKWQWILVVELLVAMLCFWNVLSIKQQVMRPYTRALLHLDAIIQEDYNQFGKSAFSHGKVKEFHQQLKVLSEKLQTQKSHYDQQAFLVYQLISQLDTPVLVFNEKQQLTLGNEAFYHLFKQPWQMFRHATADLLGLHYGDDGWQFIDQAKQNRWQIRHSEFIDDGENHQLLVFIDIEPALRESQLNAWQQIIRVLGHEIRNSLTPVSSMAETLADKASNERDKMVLGVITERCQHLQSFVNRYASISQQIQIHCQWLSIKHVIKSTAGLFNDVNIILDASVDGFWADGEFFEQIFINLFKNSQEAGATDIRVTLVLQDQYYIMEVIDNGHGFSNLSNLFVPLYSTKPQGQGIGLSFCRNIIEQHHGVMELNNNDNEKKGVTVMIVLPKPSKNVP